MALAEHDPPPDDAGFRWRGRQQAGGAHGARFVVADFPDIHLFVAGVAGGAQPDVNADGKLVVLVREIVPKVVFMGAGMCNKWRERRANCISASVLPRLAWTTLRFEDGAGRRRPGTAAMKPRIPIAARGHRRRLPGGIAAAGRARRHHEHSAPVIEPVTAGNIIKELKGLATAFNGTRDDGLRGFSPILIQFPIQLLSASPFATLERKQWSTEISTCWRIGVAWVTGRRRRRHTAAARPAPRVHHRSTVPPELAATADDCDGGRAVRIADVTNADDRHAGRPYR